MSSRVSRFTQLHAAFLSRSGKALPPGQPRRIALNLNKQAVSKVSLEEVVNVLADCRAAKKEETEQILGEIRWYAACSLYGPTQVLDSFLG
jgi:hypothetical protein